jgi:hypothetical protein
VLAIQAVLNVLADVDLVNYLVRVLLQRGSENDDLVVLGHRLYELDAAWSHHKETLRTVLQLLSRGNLPQRCGSTFRLDPGQGNTFCLTQAGLRMVAWLSASS